VKLAQERSPVVDVITNATPLAVHRVS